MLQVQYVDRLLGRLLDAVPDDAVLVVAADHGSAFVSGEPKRPIEPDNAGAIAPVPFFVKLPGQTRGRVDDRAVRTMDILPTIAKAAGTSAAVEGAGRAGRRARRSTRTPRSTSPTRACQAHRAARRRSRRSARERDVVEERLLRDGIYGIGPRPDLLGRSVEPGGRTISVDPESLSCRRSSPAARARTPSSPSRSTAASPRPPAPYGSRYAALVPPSSLHAGENTVATYEVDDSGELRLIN